MKRCFSMALILALLGTMPLSAACAEETEIVSGNVEAVVAEADGAGDTGLTVEGAGEAAPEQTPNQAVEESPAIEDPAEWEASAPGLSAEIELTPEAPEGGEGEVLSADEIQEAEEGTAEDAAANPPQIVPAIEIGLKESYEGLAADAVPKSSAVQAAKWRSSNKKIVKVNPKSGVITGVRKGTATVTATTADGEEVSCEVTVKAAPKKITLDPSSLTLSVGMTASVVPVLPKGTASGTLTCTSNKKKVATVDENGVITAVGAGRATITVTTFNGKKATCKVKVLKAPAAIVFPDEAPVVGVKEIRSLDATPVAADGDETIAELAYAIDPTSPDPECVGLDDAGRIIGLRKGTAIVTAATPGGIVASCRVTVVAAPKSVKLNASSGYVGVGQTYTGLIAELIAPSGEDVCSGSVTWSSEDRDIVSIDPLTGALTGESVGETVVTATTHNKKKASCKVQVKKAPSKISAIKPQKGRLAVGEVGQYKLTFPSGSGGGVTFASSDPTIASVDNAGLVVGVAPGEVTITATTYNGKEITASLVITGSNTVVDHDGDDDSGDDIGDGKSGGKMTNAEKIEYVISVAKSKLGSPYVYGSFGPNSFDCSGFTTYCYRQVNIELKHSAYTQGYDASMQQLDMSELKRGDLVFFDTVSDSDLSDHAGLYLGSGKFIHASSSGGKVIISDFSVSGSYYNRVFSWGRRVLN